jgi:hypothetical protein
MPQAICETPNCGHHLKMHTGGQYQEECTVTRCHCKAYAATLFANQQPEAKQPKPMTPVRACQVATQLLTRLEAYALIPETHRPWFTITGEELRAIEVCRNATAKAVTSGRGLK